MALCKLSTSIISIRGRHGGVYFKKDHTGQHVQAWPRVIHGSSLTRPAGPAVPSGTSRAGLSRSWCALSGIWADVIVGTIALFWALVAGIWLWTTKKGDRVKLTNWNWFTHFNMPRYTTALPVYTEPPIGPGLLPDYVMWGDFFGKYVHMMYASDTIYEGHIVWHMRTRLEGYTKYYLWFHIDRWYIADWVGLPLEHHWWYRIDADPTGVFLPGQPADGALRIDP